jgi:nitroreductase
MKIMGALKSRRAVREFRPDPVSPEVLKELAEAAVAAPSYMNLQPWAFTIVSDPATVSRMGHEAGHYLRAHLTPTSPFFGARKEIESPDFDAFYGAPALVLINATAEGALAESSCAMAAYALMLAAHSMGLGSCYVSHALPWLRTAEGKKALGLDKGLHPVSPVVVGCAVADPASPGRFHSKIQWIGPSA